MQSLAERLRHEGWVKGKSEGLVEGQIDNAKETAKKMLFDDFPIDKIVKYTALTKQEVKELMHQATTF